MADKGLVEPQTRIVLDFLRTEFFRNHGYCLYYGYVFQPDETVSLSVTWLDKVSGLCLTEELYYPTIDSIVFKIQEDVRGLFKKARQIVLRNTCLSCGQVHPIDT